jgi:hypothetical protein
MGAPTSLLGDARAFARDFPRDRMPKGFLWDVLDYVPSIIDAVLTGRGGWIWGSTAMGGDPETGIYVPFLSGDKQFVQATDGRLYDIGLAAPYTATNIAPIARAKQNPIFFIDTVIHFDRTGATSPALITAPGGVPAIAAMNAAHPKATVGSPWKGYVVYGGAPGEENVVRFTVPNQPLAAASSFDANSFYPTALPVTALEGMRSVILIFHGGSVERLRGSQPAHGTSQGDFILEPLFDRAGTIDPLSIATWNDNCVFADEHGVHITDGSVIRNLASQGGILYFWRALYEHKISMCATTFLDYYIVTVRRSDTSVPFTLVCDLNKRQWFRFSNIPALCYLASSTGTGMERIWAGLAGKGRLARLGPCFFPVLDSVLIQDDDGTPVLPVFETPWYRLGQEGRKRIRFAYLSYDARVPGALLAQDDLSASWRLADDEDGIPPVLQHEIATRAASQALSLGYVRSPQDPAYTTLGQFPSTQGYTRYRLPVGQFPYGVAFKVAQAIPTSTLRIFDLGVEDQAGERSRV